MPLSCTITKILFLICIISCQLTEDDFQIVKYVLDGATDEFAFQKKSDVLLAVPTANILQRTRSFLISISTIQDSFDLLVIDELSTDGTRKHLDQRNIKYISPDKPNGVTYNWNMAFEYFMDNDQYNIMFLSNNDVLIPNGVIDELATSLRNCNCDLISPLSTNKGKGHRPNDGIESQLGLQNYTDVVSLDINYQVVQNALDIYSKNSKLATCQQNKRKRQFNGFFFGFTKGIAEIAFNDSTLFNPGNRNIDQEKELSRRMKKRNLKICLNQITFVYHYKASSFVGTSGNRRQKFVRSSGETIEKL
eukprot:TRINITY_DN1155_c0_g1_i2.p1 TRINITY_DN1155_c0_g1~~TRINITY_DN1155_c0_g1_i2.p1  ORF type:complete len:306 (-),score=5.26 TRINITY_DN1155_c0_g1_i2:504-1421(-)